MKIAAMFPGQGSQYPGMMRATYDSSREFQFLMNQASQIVGEDLREACFSKESKMLRSSSYSQVCLLTLGFASYQDFTQRYHIRPSFLIGHSLGEITALTAAGAFSFEDAVRLVYKRGMLMDEAGRNMSGAMIAVSDISNDELLKLCNKYSDGESVCVIAAYNGTRQTVLSGSTSAITEISKEYIFKEGGKFKRLDVAGAFHSPLMKVLEEDFDTELNKCKVNVPYLPVISTIDNLLYTDVKKIRANLRNQLTYPVLWKSGIEQLAEKGVSIFIDIGPNTTVRQLLANQIASFNNSLTKNDVFSLDVLSDRESLGRRVAEFKRSQVRYLIKVCISSKNISCLNNYNDSVITPFRQLENMYIESSHDILTDKQMRIATALTSEILLAKGYSSMYIETELEPINS